MRHVLRVAAAVPGLPGRVVEAAGARPLVPLPGPVQRLAPGGARPRARAVAIAAIAAATQEEELPAVGSPADNKPQRIHALPRSGRGGLDKVALLCDEGSGESRAPKV